MVDIESFAGKEHNAERPTGALQGYLKTDHRGLIIEVNRSAARMIGIPERYLLGYPFPLCVVIEDRRAFRFRLLHLQREQLPAGFQMRLKQSRNAEVYVHVARYTEQTRIRVRFGQRGISRRFPLQTETTVYRIIQEALTNVARHAGVEEVRVSLESASEQLRLEIADKGRGFEPDTDEEDGHRGGLAGILERVGLLGGQFRLHTAPD